MEPQTPPELLNIWCRGTFIYVRRCFGNMVLPQVAISANQFRIESIRRNLIPNLVAAGFARNFRKTLLEDDILKSVERKQMPTWNNELQMNQINDRLSTKIEKITETRSMCSQKEGKEMELHLLGHQTFKK